MKSDCIDSLSVRRNALVPQTVRGAVRLFIRGDRRVLLSLDSCIDTLATSIVIVGVSLIWALTTIFILVQVKYNDRGSATPF